MKEQSIPDFNNMTADQFRQWYIAASTGRTHLNCLHTAFPIECQAGWITLLRLFRNGELKP